MEKKENLQQFGNQMLEATKIGIPARMINIGELPQRIIPGQVRDEIPTMNQTGYMKSEFDPFGQEFIEIARSASNPVLEIGPAYGWMTHQLLEAGASVVAVDISREHLEILLQKTLKKNLDKLHVYQGIFPEDTDFEANSFDAVFVSRVMHFLTGDRIRAGLDKIYKWLTPKGSFFATNCSIFHSSVSKMKDIFDKRIRDGEEWPGRVYKSTGIDEVHNDYAPLFLNVFYEEQLRSLLGEHGFVVKKIQYFDYPGDPWPDDNKGHIAFVASKE